MNKGFDKKDWTKVCFGEVCKNLNDSERDPLGKGIDRYVGLEHLEPGNLHIKAWGNVADGTTFTKKFKPGHVLFGKRRAYQKKAALANFEGLCSGDILVFVAIEKVIDPKLFPFLVCSDRFFDYAVQTSAGSLSPRTKFKDLANFQFLLPPKPQQARLAELLWAGDEVVERYGRIEESLKETLESFFDTVYQSNQFKFLPLAGCVEYSQYGISEQLEESGDIPVLRMNNLAESRITFDDLKYISREKIPDLEKLLLKRGDILFNRTNSYELVGKVGIYESDENATFASYLIRLKANTSIVFPEYLNLFLNSKKGQTAIRKHRTPGVSQSNINPENLKKVLVPIIPIEIQKNIVEKAHELSNSIEKAKTSRTELKEIQTHLINQIFTP